MNSREKVKEQYELLTEIESLEEIVGRVANGMYFELVGHYINLSDDGRRDINPKHNNRIVQLLKEIIIELEVELHKMVWEK